MKFLKNLILVVVILFIVVFVAAYAFVALKGKDIVCQQARAVIGREVRISSISLIPPKTIIVKGLSVENLVSVGSLSVDPSIAGLLAGKIGINKVVINDAKVTMVRYPGNQFNFSDIVTKIQSQKGGKQPDIFVKEAFIKNASITVDDKDANMSFVISPVDVSVATSLMDLKTHFDIDAQAESQENKTIGTFQGSGWVNILKKDMDATFTLSDVAIAGWNPYIKSPKQIANGILTASAKAVSVNNDLTVDGHLETQGLQFVEEKKDGSIEAAFGNVSNVFTSTFLGKSGSAKFDFSIHTKFDQPKFEGFSFKGDIFGGVVQNVLSNPQETAQQFQAIGEQFEAIGKQFKKKFKEGSFSDMIPGKTEGQASSAPATTSQTISSNQSAVPETQPPAQTSPEQTVSPTQAQVKEPSETEKTVSTVVDALSTLGVIMKQSREQTTPSTSETQNNQTTTVGQ